MTRTPFGRTGTTEALRLFYHQEEAFQGDADLIMFHSTVRGFYELVGFEPMDEMVTLIGDPSHTRRSNDIGFMRFVSEKGKQGREQFAKGTLYFGDDTW